MKSVTQQIEEFEHPYIRQQLTQQLASVLREIIDNL